MSEYNSVEQIIVPETPNVVSDEVRFVYTPRASYSKPGSAFFSEKHFKVSSKGKVEIPLLDEAFNNIDGKPLLKSEILPIATNDTVGGVKIGSGFSVGKSGEINNLAFGISISSYLKENLIPQSFVRIGDGIVATNTGEIAYSVNAPLKIEEGTKYLILDNFIVQNQYVYAVAFYSGLPSENITNGTFIAGFDTHEMTSATATTLEIPEGTNYIVFTIKNGVIPSAFLSNEKYIERWNNLDVNMEILDAQVVKITPQKLTNSQKTQSRKNIGMFDFEVVDTIGKNLFDKSTTVNGCWWTNATQEEPVANQYTASYVACSAKIREEKTITFSLTDGTGSSALVNIIAIDSNDNILSKTDYAHNLYYNGAITVTLPDDTYRIRFNLSGMTDVFDTYKLMVNEGTEALPYEDYVDEKKIVIPGLIYTDEEMQMEIDEMKEKVDAFSESNVYGKITLGKKIYAVVGDTMQMFFDSIIEGDISNMVVKLLCAKGRNYPRYYEVTPTASDVGSYEMSITLYDFRGNILDSVTTTLEIVSANNPTNTVNVLCVGDSTMTAGQIPIEASRRIKGTSGVATTPTALSLNNYNFVGRKKNSTIGDAVGWEGTGGWTYNSYNSAGDTAVRVNVTNATSLSIGDRYSVNGYTLEIAEINVTNGTGNVRFLFFYTTPYNSDFDATPTSGTLTKVSGSGQDSVSYTDLTVEQYQPFWNTETNSFDIATYRDMYCDGQIDIICVLLGVNNLIGGDAFKDISSIVEQGKTFFRNIHSQLPNCKIIVSTVPIASINGGIAANYMASGTSGAFNANGLNHKIRAYNEALITLENDEEFSSYVIIANSHAQFDAKYGYPTSTKAINTRVATTETLQLNAVHPNDAGYWQLSDALAFRAVLGVI